MVDHFYSNGSAFANQPKELLGTSSYCFASTISKGNLDFPMGMEFDITLYCYNLEDNNIV